MTQSAPPTLHVPARDVPMPASASRQAQAMLAMPRQQVPPYPPTSDKDAWRRMIEQLDRAITPLLEMRVGVVDAVIDDVEIAGVRAYDIRPSDIAAADRRVLIDIHGGAYILGFGDACRAQATGVAAALGRRVISIDYRSPPDFPYPAPLDDCIAVYKVLLQRHGAANIVVGGTSAGANLTAALVLRARDEGLPIPAGAIMNTPHLDMTNGSDSLHTNQGLDAVLSGPDLNSIREIYAGGRNYRDPYVSPLFGDFTKGFPPSFLSTGTRDLFLSDTVRMHAALRAADVNAELHVTEAASHGNFHGAPEEQHIVRETRKFLARVWPDGVAGVD